MPKLPTPVQMKQTRDVAVGGDSLAQVYTVEAGVQTSTEVAGEPQLRNNGSTAKDASG